MNGIYDMLLAAKNVGLQADNFNTERESFLDDCCKSYCWSLQRRKMLSYIISNDTAITSNGFCGDSSCLVSFLVK